VTRSDVISGLALVTAAAALVVALQGPEVVVQEGAVGAPASAARAIVDGDPPTPAVVMRPVAADPSEADNVDRVAAAVADALEDERQETLDRQIELRQERNAALIDAFAEQVELSRETKQAVRSELFQATRNYSLLIAEGMKASRPWEEIREDMHKVRDEGGVAVKALLPPEQYVILAKLVAERGSVIALPMEDAEEPEPGSVSPMRIGPAAGEK
jgi:parvulin-like peptidyl-prolyl isomerase